MDDPEDRLRLIGQVQADQARASDPHASAWVSANAGSGKTHVLAQRVIRLLLQGNRPSGILCLTYTKAAAAEMANRVFARLAEWTRLSDEVLSERIEEIEGQPPSEATLLIARQLFARALETPGGLKIQTIHAFCEAILHQFPLEANVAGHFEILDDGGTATLLGEARRILLTAAAAEDDRELAAAFQYVIEAGGEFGLENLLTAIVANRADIRRFTTWAEAHGGMEQALRRGLELSPFDDAKSIEAAAWPFPTLQDLELKAYCAAAAGQKGKKASEFADELQAIAEASPERRWSLIRHAFFTGTGAPRKLGMAAPKDVVAQMPDAPERIEQALEHVCAVADRLARFRVFEASRAAMILARRLDADYESLKREHGRLDFDDLVARTAELLERGGAGRWVHYKLDQGIDHILLDEAQDTSPPQWSVIRALADDFFAGEGTRPRRRTLFVVGDEKQSIYSFQGARPERFDSERRSVEARVRDAAERFEPVRLTVSFRSTADVLSAVDQVFAVADNRRGLGSDTAIVHESARSRQPGLVDVWEMIRKEDAPETSDWTAPFDAVLESAPPARLARRVAATLKQWIGHETIRDGQGRRLMRPGDVLVLVRKRDAFVSALTRELKLRSDIPVAGADRLHLADHIAVQDLAALGRVMLLPDDDLSLAAVLKSPLFGIGEEALYELAAERGEDESLFRQLHGRAADGTERWAGVAAELERWRDRAEALPVFEFYAELLSSGKGRRRFLARLGSEVGDVLDEFLSFAIDYEGTAAKPGLQGFLDVLEAESPEIKREMEKDRNEVRIMTVHASKGLEAPVVFLVDPGGAAVHSSHVPAVRSLSLEHVSAGAPPAIVWVPAASFENTLTRAVKDELRSAGEEEYRRLLYVGMTRAADRLVVCGYQNAADPKHSFWQQMVYDALSTGGATITPTTFAADGEQWQGLRYRVTSEAVESAVASAAEARAIPSTLPDCLRAAPRTPPRLPRPLAPSGTAAIVDGDHPERPLGSPIFAADRPAGDALERGRIVHRLLEVLPTLPEVQWRERAERYVERSAAGLLPAQRSGIIDPVLSILRDPRFAPVFAHGSAAEVSLMGTIAVGGREYAVSGRVDRLVVTDEKVLVVDYKTNRPPCLSAEDVPASYRAQLAIYRAVLAPLYPGRRIEAALVFTEAPVLIALGESDLEAALAALAAT